MSRRAIFLGMLTLWGAVAVGGCSRSPRVSFYTLTSTPAPASSAAGALLAVGPVTLPEMVDRPQLVVRQGENRVSVLEAQRWAEPLKTGIPRVVAEELRRLLGGQVAWYPQHAADAAQYRVQMDIQRFEAAVADAVTVEALWTVRRAADSFSLSGHSLVREPVHGAGYEGVVAAYSRALAAVSREVAQGVRAAQAAVPQPVR